MTSDERIAAIRERLSANYDEIPVVQLLSDVHSLLFALDRERTIRREAVAAMSNPEWSGFSIPNTILAVRFGWDVDVMDRGFDTRIVRALRALIDADEEPGR